tara:strand:- start:458 stop:1510 length:1053 start_codon:yes stop_codon:yes gene_type:complete
MATRKKPSTIAEAKKAKSKTFYGKGNKELAAVTKEELEKSGLSLRDYLNKQQGKTRRTAAKVAPRPKPRPSKRSTDTDQRPDNRPVKPKAKAPAPKRKIPAILKESKGVDLSASELKSTPKSSPRGSSAPINITGGTVPSRGTGKTDPYKYVGKGPRGKQGQAPIPTTEEKIGMASLVLGGLGGPGAKLATKAATTYGKPFVNQLIRKIKNLSKKEQEDILKSVARSKLSKKDMNIALRNAETPKDIRAVIARQKSAESGKRAPGEKPFRQTTVRKKQEARNRQKRQETQKKQELERMNVQGAGSTRIPSARLRKKGGPIKKYNKGGKVVNRKGGGMVGSGNDLVASIYD